MINNYSCSVANVVLGIVSNIFTIYLICILYLFKDICVVCVSMYILNAIITYLAVQKFRNLAANGAHKKKMK